MHLKQIQVEIGPNPKATMRYLKKRGINYKELKEKLTADNKAPKTIIQLNKDRNVFKMQKKKKPVPIVVPHKYLEE